MLARAKGSLQQLAKRAGDRLGSPEAGGADDHPLRQSWLGPQGDALCAGRQATDGIGAGGGQSGEEEPALGVVDPVLNSLLPVPVEAYSLHHEVKLLVGSLNCNGRQPAADEDLGPWLGGGRFAECVAVGLQEMVPLNPQTVVIGAGAEAADRWDQLIGACLNSAPPGTGLPKEQLQAAAADVGKWDVGAMAAAVEHTSLEGASVWVRRALLPHIRGVQALSVGTGMLGMLGNKGAVAVRMRVYDSSLCIISSHLTSGEGADAMQRRLFDYGEVVRRGYFAAEGGAEPASQVPEAWRSGPAAQSPGQWGADLHVFDSEVLIWAGDLNFRLQGVDDLQARAMIRAGRLSELLAADELTAVMQAGAAFEGFVEGQIRFAPTFKLRRGTCLYIGESALVRTPAWTDRILYRELRLGAARLASYCSAPGILLSDHSPVLAAFILQAKEYDRQQIGATVDAARQVVDAREMAATPHCQLAPTSLDVGLLTYGYRRTGMHVQLTATGGSGAAWELVPVPGATAACPIWLSLEPASGLLHPGESTELVLSARVTGGSAGGADLVVGEAGGQLDAVLFLSVSGRYQSSFFGLSLDTLAALPRPLYPAAVTAAVTANSGDDAGQEEERGVPPEVLHLARLLREGSNLGTPGLFLSTAEAAAAAASGPVEACCLGVQEGMAGPVVEDALAVGSHAATYHCLMRLFRDALAPRHTARSGLSAGALAAVLADAVFPPLPGGGPWGEGAAVQQRRVAFVHQLLEAAEGWGAERPEHAGGHVA
eukprot:scaffold8.g1580.t1